MRRSRGATIGAALLAAAGGLAALVDAPTGDGRGAKRTKTVPAAVMRRPDVHRRRSSSSRVSSDEAQREIAELRLSERTVVRLAVLAKQFGPDSPVGRAAYAEIARRRDAAAELVEALGGESYLAAHDALVTCNDHVVPLLLDASRSADEYLRYSVLYVLVSRASEERPSGIWRSVVLQRGFELLDDPDEDVRDAAGELVTEFPEALARLRERALSGSLERRIAALYLIADMDEVDEIGAVDVLDEVLRDENEPESIRIVAALARSWWIGTEELPEFGGDADVPPAVRLWVLAGAADRDETRDRAGDLLVAEHALAYLAHAALTTPDDGVVETVVDALPAAGASGLAQLVALCGADAPPPVRSAALGRLDDLVRDAPDVEDQTTTETSAAAVCAFVAALRAEDEDVRTAAASGLIGLHESGRDVLPELFTAFDEDPGSRAESAWALAETTPDAAGVAERLSALFLDPAATDEQRRVAVVGLGRSDVRDGFRSIVGRALADRATAVRAAAFEAARESDIDEEALCTGLTDEDGDVRTAAVKACGEFEHPGSDLVERLAEMAVREDGGRRTAVLEVLSGFGEDAAIAGSVLRDALVDPEGRVAVDVAECLARVMPRESAVPLLADRLRACRIDERPARSALSRCLEYLGWVPDPRDLDLILGLSRTDHSYHDGTWWTRMTLLGRIGRAAHDQVPALIAEAQVNTENRRGHVLEVLGRVSLGEPETIRFLVRELRSGNYYYGCTNAWNVPADAAEALGAIGPAAASAVPALTEALSFPICVVGKRAADAIESITGTRPDVREADDGPDGDR